MRTRTEKQDEENDEGEKLTFAVTSGALLSCIFDCNCEIEIAVFKWAV